MLAQAKRKAQQQSLEIRWVQADGRNFKLGQHYANPQICFLAEDPQRRYERARYDDPQGNGEVIIEETREYIAARQIMRSTRYYHIGPERNKWTGRLELRCSFPCELDLLLEHHGFHSEEK